MVSWLLAIMRAASSYGGSRQGAMVLLLMILPIPFPAASFQRLPLKASPGDGCGLTCPRESRRMLLCGSDGKTYRSACDLQRAHCSGRDVRFVRYGQCLANAKVKYKRGSKDESLRCAAQRNSALAQSKHLEQGLYVPQCEPDGTFTAVQCHQATGYCWCSDPLGKPIPGTTTRHNVKPDCSTSLGRKTHRRTSRNMPKNMTIKAPCLSADREVFNKNLINVFRRLFTNQSKLQGTDSRQGDLVVALWQFSQLDRSRDEILKEPELRNFRRFVRTHARPRRCAVSVVAYCDSNRDKAVSRNEWVICLGLDPSLQADGDSSSSGPDSLLNSGGSQGKWNEEANNSKRKTSPSCKIARTAALEQNKLNPTSRPYVPQCDPVTEALYRVYQCHTDLCWCVHPRTGKPIKGTLAEDFKDSCRTLESYKGCSIQKKQTFLMAMLNKVSDKMVEMTKNITSSAPTTLPTLEDVARWKFGKLDANRNELLDKKEWASFRKEWKSFLQELEKKKRKHHAKLRKCWRNFPKYCDKDSNSKISLSEWLSCTGALNPIAAKNFNVKVPRNGQNPFQSILKSD